MRATARALLPRGRFSSMLDMGGVSAPAGKSAATRIDTGKNNKVRCVALDFDLITRSIEASRALLEQQEKSNLQSPSSASSTAKIDSSASVKPNLGMVENIANLLNVELGGEGGFRRRREATDDLSTLTSSPPEASNAPENAVIDDPVGKSILGALHKTDAESPRRVAPDTPRPSIGASSSSTATVSTKAPPVTDVRAKYAAKLRSKLDGGLAGVDLAKAEREDTLRRGDAGGHLAARKIAAATPAEKGGSRWLATTGTGNLLTYLTNRSMGIALLPKLVASSDPIGADESKREGERMDELTKQLPQVRFGLLVKDGQDKEAAGVLDRVRKDIDVPAIATLVVSDRDDYLRAAKEGGMFTCRVRPKNAPRGNVTTNYSVSEVGEVEEVVNELNGISFNSVFGAAAGSINYGGV